jgi:hypothetical protein
VINCRNWLTPCRRQHFVSRRVFHLLVCLSLSCACLTALLWLCSFRGTTRFAYWMPPGCESQFMIGLVCYSGEACFHGAMHRFPAAERDAYLESMFGPLHPGVPRTMEGNWGVLTSFEPWRDRASQDYEESLRNYDLPRFYWKAKRRRNSSRGPIDEAELRVPCWALVATACVLPAVWIRSRVRSGRRKRRGLCLRCGYDLRASGGRCPECGYAAPTATRITGSWDRDLSASVTER